MMESIFVGSERISVPRVALTTLFWSTQPNAEQPPNGAAGDKRTAFISDFFSCLLLLEEL
jgi:hypothetical protein